MPKVKLRWLDGRETVYEHQGLPAVLVLPGDDRQDHRFRLANNPDPLDIDDLPVYKDPDDLPVYKETPIPD